MPELPEVETIRRGLSKLIIGREILAIETDSSKQLQPSPAKVRKGVVGATIKAVKRRAKLLQLFLSNGKILAIHLKLTGRLLVRKKGIPRDDWQRVTLFLSGNKELRFTDLRKFGWLKLVENEEGLEKLLAAFGPEPLDDFNLPRFQAVLASSSQPIKIVLMNQKKIAGIGNIYANEALFVAKIDPRQPANKISQKEEKRLYLAIEKVLKAGIKYRGASHQYYLDVLGHRGSYQEHFLVYGRQGKACPKCGEKIKKIKVGGRGTYFCPKCQR